MAIAVAFAAAVGLVVGHSFPDYDATFALIWGHDLATGHAPDYAIPYRPAGHPLLMLVTIASSPLGREGAAEVVRWMALLGGGLFVAAMWRLGREYLGAAGGAVAALLLATRMSLWEFSLLAYMDQLAAAFVLYAIALEARTPRRGGPVFLLLALAGLLRPEVWLFTAVYWVWCSWGSRERALRLAPLAALGPLLWVTYDLVTTQTFLGSVIAGQDAPSAPSSGGKGLGHVPRALVEFTGGFVRPPEAVAAAVGVGLALWYRDRRMLLPLSVIALNVLTFVLVGARNGPLEQRYLIIACGLTLLFSVYPLVRGPRPLALAVVLAFIAYAPVDAARIGHLREQARVAQTADTELRALVEARAECLRRTRLHLPNVRLRPFVAYWSATAPERAGTGTGESDLVATGAVARQLASRSLPHEDLAATSDEWHLTGACARQ